MKKKSPFLTILLLALLSLPIKAQSDFQPGYVIKNNGDTIKGFIDLRSPAFNSEKCVFKSTPENEPSEYLPGEIKAYRFINDKYFTSKQITIDSVSKLVFLEFLVEGKANLYLLQNRKEIYYFIEKENAPIYCLKESFKVINIQSNEFFEYGNNVINYSESKDYIREDNAYKGALIYYLQDYPEIRKEVYRMDFDQKDLIKIAVDYHNYVCEDEGCIVYSKNPKTQYSLGIILGANYNSIIYQYAYSNLIIEEGTSNSGFNIGFNWDVYTPSIMKRFFQTLSVSYSRVEQNTNSQYRVIHVIYENVNLSANVYYCYNHYKLQPYAGAGFFASQSLKSSKVFEETEFYPFDPRKTSLSAIFTFGAKYPINKKVYTKVECSYQPRMFEKSAEGSLITQTKNIFGTIAVMYSF